MLMCRSYSSRPPVTTHTHTPSTIRSSPIRRRPTTFHFVGRSADERLILFPASRAHGPVRNDGSQPPCSGYCRLSRHFPRTPPPDASNAYPHMPDASNARAMRREAALTQDGGEQGASEWRRNSRGEGAPVSLRAGNGVGSAQGTIAQRQASGLLHGRLFLLQCCFTPSLPCSSHAPWTVIRESQTFSSVAEGINKQIRTVNMAVPSWRSGHRSPTASAVRAMRSPRPRPSLLPCGCLELRLLCWLPSVPRDFLLLVHMDLNLFALLRRFGNQDGAPILTVKKDAKTRSIRPEP